MEHNRSGRRQSARFPGPQSTGTTNGTVSTTTGSCPILHAAEGGRADGITRTGHRTSRRIRLRRLTRTTTKITRHTGTTLTTSGRQRDTAHSFGLQERSPLIILSARIELQPVSSPRFESGYTQPQKASVDVSAARSEEHTSELQSRPH